eukprot:1196009-Prorocentrum_minimum.AAC.2
MPNLPGGPSPPGSGSCSPRGVSSLPKLDTIICKCSYGDVLGFSHSNNFGYTRHLKPNIWYTATWDDLASFNVQWPNVCKKLRGR